MSRELNWLMEKARELLPPSQSIDPTTHNWRADLRGRNKLITRLLRENQLLEAHVNYLETQRRLAHEGIALVHPGGSDAAQIQALASYMNGYRSMHQRQQEREEASPESDAEDTA